ncbi:MAG: hypothetical protein K2G03_02380, partial [Bacilli bacterium]|nr:hypothetical protein [Bacilli bacterium]
MSRRAKIGIMIALLALTVGFAAITTTLVVNGTLSIGPDGAGFDSDVIFSRAKISDGSGNAFISSDGKSLQFNADLMELGSEVDLRYDITNKNRQYDAKGTIECDFVDETNAYNGYITITETPKEFEVKGGTKTSGHVIVRLVKSFAGDETINSADIGFKCTINLEANERDDLAPEIPPVYVDETLNGADPVLTGGLVPVNLTNDGKVIYADMYEKWYDYSTRRWANAVIIKSEAASKYDEGDVIKEEDIESYFVWIPRYRYKLWNVDSTSVSNVSTTEVTGAQTIEITFETKNVEPSMGSKNGEWLTHPAFTNFDVNGIWVGKYETGIASAKDKASSVSNKTDVSEVIVKPNTFSWRGNKVIHIFRTAYDYNRALDSHMIKNTEWGAVAYLSHSEYGINDNMRINNNSNFLTGYAYTRIPTCVQRGTNQCYVFSVDEKLTQPYNTETGYLASTTGNVTGVYDMSGGTEEYVAAYVEGSLSGSGFKAADLEGFEKYFDVYPADSTKTSYANRILGDATGEMGPFYNFEDDDEVVRGHSNWYLSVANFVENGYNSWFVRGGRVHYGSIAGQVAVSSISGGNATQYGS